MTSFDAGRHSAGSSEASTSPATLQFGGTDRMTADTTSKPDSMHAGPPVDSYTVHLDSLTDFGRELDTQIEGMNKPADGLAALASHTVLLGQFGEAAALGTDHQSSVEQMHQLLGQVKQAIVFARDVTSTVSSGYENADKDVASGLASHTGGDDVAVSTSKLMNEAAAATGGTTSIGSGVESAVSGIGATVAGAVGSIASDVTSTVGHDVAGIADDVGKAVGGLLGGGH